MVKDAFPYMNHFLQAAFTELRRFQFSCETQNFMGFPFFVNADFRFSLLLVILNCFPPSDNPFMYFSRTEA